MITCNLPLSAHPSCRARTIDRLAEPVHHKWLSASIIQTSKKDHVVDAGGNHLDLPSTVLWSCLYGLPLHARLTEGQDLRIQFQERGSGATRTNNEVIAVNQEQSCVCAGRAEVDFGEGFVQVAWRVPLVTLERKLVALTGQAVTHRLEFDPVLDLMTPQSRAMLQVLQTLIEVINAGPAVSGKSLRVELESALLVSLLCAARHNYRDLLDRNGPTGAPSHVRRAEDFIEANWDKPITLDDIVTASGASARSVFRAFRQSRNYTPLQYRKNVRLRHAKRLLEDDSSTLSVTEVARTCGFPDLTRFSKDFSGAFGVPPSTLVQHKRSTSASGHDRRRPD
jgi:AraC-like DNA-binding protein